MKLIRTLFAGSRSLIEILVGPTRIRLILCTLGLGIVVAAASSATAAPFLDDFSTDTSANYTFEDSFGAGGSFDVSGGTLNITTATSNTATVTRNTALNFAVGESLGVDVPARFANASPFLTLGTAVGQPGGAIEGYRWRRDNTGVRIQSADEGIILGPFTDPGNERNATLWIDRIASDTFEFRMQLENGFGRPSFGTDTYAALDGLTDLFVGMQAFDTGPNTLAFDNLRIVDTASLTDISLKMAVDRDTGGLTLHGDANSAVTILSYSLTSARESLDQAGWTSISGNYDAVSNGGDGSVDDNTWFVLSATGSHTELAEAEIDLSGGDGATLAAGAMINLSQTGNAWIKNPVETDDLTFTVLFSNGSVERFPVEFTGNSGNAFKSGDLNFDDSIDGSDWIIFRDNHLADLSGLVSPQSYQVGDLDEDGDNDLLDFRLFETAFDDDQGAGAFQAMLNAVPEPSSAILLGLGACLALVRRRNSSNFLLGRGSQVFRQQIIRCSMLAVVMGAVLNFTIVDVEAAPVSFSWSAFDDLAKIDTSGSLVEAVNIEGAAVTLNTVDFAAHSQAVDGNAFFDNTGLANVSFINATTTVSDTLLTNGERTSGSSTPANRGIATFSSLSIGVDYLFQFMSIDNRGGEVNNEIAVADSDPGPLGSSRANYDFDHIDHSTATGAIVTGTFTADAASQSIYVSAFTNDTTDAELGTFVEAFQLRNLSPVPTLTLSVNATTGDISLSNSSGSGLDINYYLIESAAGALDPTGWNSLDDQDFDPAGLGIGESWDEAGGSDEFNLAELYLQGSSNFADGDSANLGSAFDPSVFGVDQDGDLEFLVSLTSGVTLSGNVEYVTGSPLDADFDQDGDVDGSDFLTWQRGNGAAGGLAQGDADGNGTVNGLDLTVWENRYGGGAASGALAGVAVPEPSSLLLVLLGLAGLSFGSARHGIARNGRVIKFPQKMPWTNLAVLFVAWAVGGSTALASVTNDREYRFGDPGTADATLAPPTVDTAANVGEGNPMGFVFGSNTSTGDEVGPSGGGFIDLEVFGSTYTSTASRPGASVGDFGANFDGINDYLRGERLGLPSTSASSTTGGGPLNYEGISNRGYQFWVNPNSAGNGATQTLVTDTEQHGVQISSAGNWVMQFGGTDVDSGIAVNFDVWSHVMLVRPLGNVGARLYVDGVTVAAAAGGYDGTDDTSLVVGANGGLTPGTADFFQGVIDDLELFVLGTATAAPFEDYGTFDYTTDNPIAAATLTGVDGDVNQDGLLSSLDVDGFIAGWSNVNQVNGIQVGDITTITDGDLNMDGITDFEDIFQLHESFVSAGLGGLAQFGFAVPEPTSITMMLGSFVSLTLIRTMRGRHAR